VPAGEPIPTQARVVGARRGAAWLREGARLFRAAPFGWIAIVFAYWLITIVVSLVPLAGAAVATMMVPAFSLGFMAAARAAGAGGRIEPALLFEGFRHERRAMLALGVVYLACLALILGATALIDGGALAGWMTSGVRPGDEVLQTDAFLWALVCGAALYVPVMMLFWFAPPLAAWHATGAAKALFFSFFACLINWQAFLAYAAVTALVALLVPFLLLLIVASLAGPAPVATILFPALVVLLPVLFASFYASYRDVFGVSDYSVAP
jgi:hypothetical protein